jgi:hypothetical protein
VPSVDVVQNTLADQVVGNREALQVMFFQKFAFALAVAVFRDCFADFEVVAPTRQFQAVVAEVTSFLAQVF